MSINFIKLIIFDLDGTIIDLHINWNSVKNKLKELFNRDVPSESLFSFIEYITINNTNLRKEAFKIIELEELKCIEDIIFDPELYKLFEKLKERNKMMALVTLQSKTVASMVLNKLKILNFFSIIISREDSLDRKIQIKQVLLKLGFNVELIDQYSNVRHKFLTRFLSTRLKPIDLHYIDFGLIRIFFLINLILFLCSKVNFLLIHLFVCSQK